MTVDEAMQLAMQHHRAGKLAEAESICRQVLAVAPEHADAWHCLGVLAGQAGRGDAAIAMIGTALRIRPESVEANNNLGTFLVRQGRAAEAVEAYRRALAGNPNHAETHNNLGVVLKTMGRFDEAAAACRRAVELRPDYVEGWFNLGLALQELGRSEEAVGALGRVIELRGDCAEAYQAIGLIRRRQVRVEEALAAYRFGIERCPGSADLRTGLGETLFGRGDLAGAIGAFRAAVQCNPQHAEAWYNLGVSLRLAGELTESAAVLQRAIERRPGHAASYDALGSALKDQGRLTEAIAVYRRAVSLDPNQADIQNNLGVALSDNGEDRDAIAAYRRAIELKPALAEAHNNLGMTLKDLGTLDEALEECRRAMELRPDAPQTHCNVGSILKDRGDLEGAIAAYRRALRIAPHPGMHSNLILALQYQAGDDERIIREEHERWNSLYVVPLRQTLRPHTNKRDPERVLRVGYVSPDFTGHPVGRFVLPLFEQHDASRFEVYCYSGVLRADSVTQRLKSRSKVWRNLLGVPDDQAAEQIRADGIDILVDLSMHTAQNRLPLFGRKPAPVQVTYLAYASGTGLETMDYRLTDPYLDPEEASDGATKRRSDEGEEESAESPSRSASPGVPGEGAGGERAVRLPRTYWCYRPVIGGMVVNELPALQSGTITFGCLNNFSKVTEAALRTWCELLRRVPQSRLLLHAHEGTHRDRTCELLEREGISRERMTFVSRLPGSEYFRQYGRIDIALDAFPFAGGTTTCDALWMGVPVVSLAGKTGVSRGGLSVLSNVGLGELVASSVEQYVEIAVKLAGDLPRLAEMRRTLRGRMEKSPLMDEAGFARDVEEAYRWMWREWCGR